MYLGCFYCKVMAALHWSRLKVNARVFSNKSNGRMGVSGGLRSSNALEAGMKREAVFHSSTYRPRELLTHNQGS
jgi:hypothetical protein